VPAVVSAVTVVTARSTGAALNRGSGALRVCEATTPVVDRAISAIKQKSPSRARTATVVISQIMGYATRQGAVTVNPVREVGRIDDRPKKPPRALAACPHGAGARAVAGRRRRAAPCPALGPAGPDPDHARHGLPHRRGAGDRLDRGRLRERVDRCRAWAEMQAW
jgi:hypothetical protein